MGKTSKLKLSRLLVPTCLQREKFYDELLKKVSLSVLGLVLHTNMYTYKMMLIMLVLLVIIMLVKVFATN